MSVALWERNGHEVTDAEGVCLYGLARMVPQSLAIVEVGSYRGRSTCFLAAGSHAGSRAPVYAVDLWTDAPEMQAGRKGKLRPYPYSEVSSREAFDAAIKEHGHGLVTPVQGASVEVAKLFGAPVGLLFLDGSHAYDDVMDDLFYWCMKIPVGGVVAVHDWHFKAVRKAVKHSLLPRWRKVGKAERIRVIERVP